MKGPDVNIPNNDRLEVEHVWGQSSSQKARASVSTSGPYMINMESVFSSDPRSNICSKASRCRGGDRVSIYEHRGWLNICWYSHTPECHAAIKKYEENVYFVEKGGKKVIGQHAWCGVISTKKKNYRGAWLAPSEDHATLDLRVVSSSHVGCRDYLMKL